MVGAGAAGLAVSKQLLLEEKVPFSEVILIDDSDGVGGLWNRSPRESDLNVPCESSGSPVYDDLHTNLLKDFMSFSDFRYPIQSTHFPPHTAVKQYLEDYAHSFIPNHCIKLKTHVKTIRKLNGQWVLSCLVRDGHQTENIPFQFTCQYVVVCSGHYRFPLVPSFRESPALGSSRIRKIHSSAFQRPSDFRKYRRILIVGSRASARDLCVLLLQHNRSHDLGQEVYITIRGGVENLSFDRRAFIKPVIKHGAQIRGDVEFIDHQNGEVTFSATPLADTKGSVKEHVDLIIYATGYLHQYPFLTNAVCVDSGETDSSDTGDGYHSICRDSPLLHRIVSLEDPTLMFVGTPNLLLSPCIVFEYQARYVAQLISGRIQLPANFASLLGAFTAAKCNFDLTVTVGRERVALSEFDMASNLMWSNPSYCNRLAVLTNAQGYWSQLFWQRLMWVLTSLLYQLAFSLLPCFSRWLARS